MAKRSTHAMEWSTHPNTGFRNPGFRNPGFRNPGEVVRYDRGGPDDHWRPDRRRNPLTRHQSRIHETAGDTLKPRRFPAMLTPRNEGARADEDCSGNSDRCMAWVEPASVNPPARPDPSRANDRHRTDAPANRRNSRKRLNPSNQRWQQTTTSPPQRSCGGSVRARVGAGKTDS